MEKISYEELEQKLNALELEVARGRRFEKINKTLSEIALSVSSAENLDELFQSIHASLGKIIDTTNIYIALYDELHDTITFPYSIDITQVEYPPHVGATPENSLTARVLTTKRPLLITGSELLRQQEVTGRKSWQGVIPEIWMGIPLIARDTLIGAIVVQSYEAPDFYDGTDVETMSAVATQVAIAIERKQIEEKLQTSINRFHKIIEDVSGIAIQGYDENRHTIFWNKASERLYGYSEQEALGKPLETLIIPSAHRAEMIKKHRQWVDDDDVRPDAEEIVLTNKNGEDVVVFSSHVMYETANGKEMYCIDLDLRPIKTAEESLRVANAQFTAAMDSIDAIVYVADMETFELLFMNTRARQVSGAKIGEICWSAFHCGQDGPCSFCTNKKLLDGGGKPAEPFIWEMQNSKDGEWYQCSDQAILWPDDRVVRLQIAVNINARKEMEEKLRESEQKHRVIFENSPLGLIYFSSDGIIIDCNDRFVGIMGSSKEKLIGLNAVTNSSPVMQAALEQALAGEIASYEDLYTSITGTKTTFIRVMFNPVSPGEDSSGVIATFEDISERKHIEKEREKLEFQLQQAQKIESIGRLAGGVAHDFNNMLGVILGRTEMIMGDTDDSFVFREDIHEIYKAAKRSADLTSQLLAFARKQTVLPRVVDLHTKVSEIFSMLKRLIGEDIELINSSTGDIWPVRIDPGQIDQILTNLSVNARDAISGHGQIKIGLRNTYVNGQYDFKSRKIQSGDYVLLSVSDNGCGMGKEILENLFEPFFTTKDVGKGTGLGLATVYGVVQQNKGFVDVESGHGGSTFSVYLPRCVPENRVQSAPTIEQDHENGGTILLVEDEPAILALTRTMLERLGYAVMGTDSPEQALQMAKTYDGSIDIILTDVIMPEMDGRRLAGKIHTLYPDIRTLFMSGYTDDVIASSGVLEEGVHFIQKPFTKSELANKLYQLSSEHQK